MSVITISRGSLSGGKVLAEQLGRTLKYRCLDREALVARAAEEGISQDELRQALLAPPRLRDRFQHKKYRYLAHLQAVLAEAACGGRMIYHGNAGHLLLRGGPPVLRVRIVAPLEFRIAMARQNLCLDRSEAIRYIEDADRQRQKWTQFLYNADWTDPSLYDFVVNLETMGISEACLLVSAAVQQRSFEFTPQWRAAMTDFALASRVRASLALNPATAHLEFEVEAHGDRVSVRGRVYRIEQMEEVQRVAKAVPGVVECAGNVFQPPLPD